MLSETLSKSRYLRGLQCHKSLWLLMKGEIKPTPTSDSKQEIFNEGNRVGEIAQKLFPGGKLIKYEGSDVDEKIAKTKEWIASGESTIYEATFKFDDIIKMEETTKITKYTLIFLTHTSKLFHSIQTKILHSLDFLNL